jgi:hypothetical protein
MLLKLSSKFFLGNPTEFAKKLQYRELIAMAAILC